MSIPDVNQLNKNFSFNNGNTSLIFMEGKGGIPVVDIKNELASAVISLQGAHLLSWIPFSEEEVIWVSDDASFAPSKSVRGGIPICWPWFGAHESEHDFPAHGFARTVYWQIKDVQQISDAETSITFVLNTKDIVNSESMWPNETVVEYQLTISKVLTLKLTTYNESHQPITIGQALHTYFNVGNLTDTTVIGLDGKSYLDKPDEFKKKIQSGPIHFTSEVDRVYLQTSDDIIINNSIRNIIIKKQGSHSTVVWNPWETVATKMGDLGENGYLKMLCVESANAADDTINIKPGESYQLYVTYQIDNL